MIVVRFHGLFVLALFLVLLFVNGPTAAAQSTDQNLPTPVLSNQINGRIEALDVGDSRLTRHFYAFQGVPGDLLVTLTSKNLNGDIDVFTAITFRPIMKIPMYASPLSPEVTKSFFLRNRQVLILRVEARTPNDDPGIYTIHFGGAYEAFSGGIPVAEENAESAGEVARSKGGSTKRLSSVGARIEEPVPEPTPRAMEKPAATASAAPPPTESEKPKAASKATTTRNVRGRRSRPIRSKPAATESEAKTEASKSEPAKSETPEAKKEPMAVVDEKPTATEKTATAEKPIPEKPAAQEQAIPAPGAHLIIEEKDGTKIDRPMSTVRRIVVEGGVIVIVLKTGRIERVPMTLVARMSIEPQQ